MFTTTFRDEASGQCVRAVDYEYPRVARQVHVEYMECGDGPCQGVVECPDWARPRHPEVQEQIDKEDGAPYPDATFACDEECDEV